MTENMKRKAKGVGLLVWIAYTVATLPIWSRDNLSLVELWIVFSCILVSLYIMYEDEKENAARWHGRLDKKQS